ncbi:MAG: DUF4340 domain-containing protein [Chthoniobacteraceae bacterium]
MKTKQLAIMIAVAAVLGGAAYYLNRTDGTGTTGGTAVGGKVIEFPLNDVAQLAIQSPSGALNLEKKDDVWKVRERADYPANFERVHGLLTKLWDLKTVQEVKAGASQFARLELAEPLAGAGAKIEFKDKDGKSLGALLLGKKHIKEGGGGGFGGDGGIAAGRYVKQPGGSRVSLISETLDEAETKPEPWLARDFIKIESPSSITLAGATDAQKWKLTRENASADWKLDGAKPEEKVDAAKVSQVGNVFAYPTFADVLNPDAKPADTGLDKPAVITLATFDGFTYVLKAGKVTGDNQPVTVEVSAQLAKERTPGKDEKPEDKTKLDEEFKAKLKRLEEKLAAEKKFEGRPFLIAKATMDQILKDRAALLEEKKPEPAPGATPPSPPLPGAPGAKVPPSPGAPISVTTPPVAVPPLPPTPAKNPAKPASKPITVTTPPVSAPPANQPQKIRTLPASAEKPKAPATPQSPPPPANPAAPK